LVIIFLSNDVPHILKPVLPALHYICFNTKHCK